MQTGYKLYDVYEDYDEIIVDKDYEHIYGYKNGEAVEIVEPTPRGETLYDPALALIREMVFLEADWKRVHKSEHEERYAKSQR